jgi:hypothetical protein
LLTYKREGSIRIPSLLALGNPEKSTKYFWALRAKIVNLMQVIAGGV